MEGSSGPHIHVDGGHTRRDPWGWKDDLVAKGTC